MFDITLSLNVEEGKMKVHKAMMTPSSRSSQVISVLSWRSLLLNIVDIYPFRSFLRAYRVLNILKKKVTQENEHGLRNNI